MKAVDATEHPPVEDWGSVSLADNVQMLCFAQLVAHLDEIGVTTRDAVADRLMSAAAFFGDPFTGPMAQIAEGLRPAETPRLTTIEGGKAHGAASGAND